MMQLPDKLPDIKDILRGQIKQLQEENERLTAKVNELDNEIIGLLEQIDPLIGVE
jgi:uncharacterized protein YoxC